MFFAAGSWKCKLDQIRVLDPYLLARLRGELADNGADRVFYQVSNNEVTRWNRKHGTGVSGGNCAQ